MLGRLINWSRPPGPTPGGLEYEEQKAILSGGDVDARTRLAGRADARPEVLYYLAEDAEPGVRRAIAANEATPIQADQVLARDANDDVRCQLALKIGRLIPNLTPKQHEDLRDSVLEILETLASDQLPRVRAILASEIKASDAVPRRVVRRLAEDIETIVSAPILEYSPLLSDADLVEIIAAGQASDALSAISRRRRVSGDVADAVVATLDVPAVAQLLVNESAQIREDTLDALIDNADSVEAWHEPLVYRPDLSVRAVRRIAGFVTSSLVSILCERAEVDEDMAGELTRAVKDRLEDSQGELEDDAAKRAREWHKLGRLDNETINEAMDANQRDFVLHALAELSGIEIGGIRRIMGSRNARTVTALAWRAGLSMRTAMRLQQTYGQIPHMQMVNARNGTDFPFDEAEMGRQLERYA